MLDGAARLKELFAEANRLGMPAVAITDHGNMHGAYDFYKQATAAGRHPGHRRRGVRGARVAAAPRRGSSGAARSRRATTSPATARYTHMTMWARNARRPEEPVPAQLAGLHRGPARQVARGWTSTSSPSTPRASWAPPAARPARCRPGCGWASSTRRSSPPRSTRRSLGKEQLLPRDHGPRPVDREAGSATACSRSAASSTSRRWSPTTRTTRTRRRPRRTTCCSACRPAATSPTPTGSASTAAATSSSRPTRCARSTPPTPGWRAAATPCWWPRRSTPTGMFTFKNLMPRFPVPDGETEE